MLEYEFGMIRFEIYALDDLQYYDNTLHYEELKNLHRQHWMDWAGYLLMEKVFNMPNFRKDAVYAQYITHDFGVVIYFKLMYKFDSKEELAYFKLTQ